MATIDVQPTQVREPGKATARTVVQTIIGIVIAAGIVVPAATSILQEELAAWLTEPVLSVLATAAAVAVAVSAIVARIMAIPQVNAALARIGLSAGAGTVVEYGADGVADVPRNAR